MDTKVQVKSKFGKFVATVIVFNLISMLLILFSMAKNLIVK